MKDTQVEIERIAKLWKVGRLLVGKTQSELSRDLGISQSSISKYESMSLEPSASDWYQFCQYVGIDAHKTLSLGYIDGKKKFKHRLFGETLLKLPVKYRQDFLLKVRELIPFRECIIKELGKESWASFLQDIKISDDIFFVYDFQISMNIFKDLLIWSLARNFPLLEKVKDFNGDLQLSGILNETYLKKKTPFDLLKALMDNQPYYHQVFNTEIMEQKNSLIVIPTVTSEAQDYFDLEILNIFLMHKINSFKKILYDNTSVDLTFEISEQNGPLSFMVSA